MYSRYRAAIEGLPLPVAIIDLDAVDANVDHLLKSVKSKGKRLRIASKSIRCVDLLRYIMDRGGDCMRGVMSYAAREATFLVEHGFDDILVAYPTASVLDAELIAEANRSATVSIIVDAPEHLRVLEAAGHARSIRIPVTIEADAAYRPLGGALHIGAQRSPLRGAEAVFAFAAQIARYEHLKLHGIMAYESQIAGMQDDNPFAPLLNVPKQLIKRLARSPLEQLRLQIADGLRERGHTIEIFNGGGTGSLHWCSSEDALTEVTAGSGFVDSHLFDYYKDFDLTPAAMFAVQVVRKPTSGLVTCHGGGYIASGECGPDKLPQPYLPEGLSLTKMEGVGEVQTPLRVPAGVQIEIGDPVFFRHAKAGELAEHFTDYQFVRGDRIERTVPTYRGMGGCFL